MDKNFFYSKILLFGEYGIMLNSDALSIPFKKFSGYLQNSNLISNEQRISNKKIIELYNYIIKNESLSKIINFQNDLTNNLQIKQTNQDLGKSYKSRNNMKFRFYWSRCTQTADWMNVI